MSDLLRYIPTTADLIINVKDYESFIQIAKNEERELIIKTLYAQRKELEEIVIGSESFGATDAKWFYQDRIKELDRYIALIKGEQK